MVDVEKRVGPARIWAVGIGGSMNVHDKVSANGMPLSTGAKMERWLASMAMWRWLGRESFSVSQYCHLQAFNYIHLKVTPPKKQANNNLIWLMD